MIIYGREVGFRRTIGADVDLEAICPGEDLNRVGELFGDSGKIGMNIGTLMKVMLILNKWYEATAKLNDPSYEPKPLTEEELLSLDEDTFYALEHEMMSAWAKDTKQTVEAVPTGKKNGRAVKSK